MADSQKKPPRFVYTRSAPHVPNLVVVARAISVGTAMRAAGFRAHATSPIGASEGASGASSGAAGSKYTAHDLEAPVTRTRVDPGTDVVPVLRRVWPEVGELGARVVAAQYAHETGGGRHCYNYNLGNHKASEREPHMYLRGVWEGLSRGEFERLAASTSYGQLVREEPASEARAKGHAVPAGKLVIILDPPHPGARFRSYGSLEEGVARLARSHQRIAERAPEYKGALATGDGRAVARVLGSRAVGYFTGNVDAYAQGITNYREIIDEGLGPP